MHTDDALRFLVEQLREAQAQRRAAFSKYGYEVYIANAWRLYAQKVEHTEANPGSDLEQQLSPAFLDAAWELCRRGVLRPGIKVAGAQATEDGNAGAGYTLTPFGKTWLAEGDDVFVPSEPERLGALLSKHAARFGQGFQQRAQEAIRCYNANAHLACCVMCGAASESILIACAEAKDGDSEKVLKAYRAAGGRKRLLDLLTGTASKPMKDGVEKLASLLAHWRDDSGHGLAVRFDSSEAFLAIATLLRYAAFVEDNWAELTSK